ncbi:hypothetical protein [Helicobacter sp. 23-1045]
MGQIQMNKIWIFLMILCILGAGDFVNKKSDSSLRGESQDSPKQSTKNNGEFIITYRAIAKNNILIGEEFKVAKALTLSQNPQIIAVCDINTNDNDSNITILKQNKDEILACFAGHLDSKIRDDIKSINNEVRTKTTFKIPAQRVLLDLQRSKIHIIGQK